MVNEAQEPQHQTSKLRRECRDRKVSNPAGYILKAAKNQVEWPFD